MLTPCPTPFNLADYVLTAGRATPDKVALAVLGPARAERWSYAKLEAAVRGMGAGLLARGLKPGDRVMLRLANTTDFPVAFLGAISVGIVPVPTAEGLTAGEVEKLLAVVAPAAILASQGVAVPDAPGCPVWTDIDDVKATEPAEMVFGDPNRLAYIVFTSGSSGVPKPVAHAHRAVWARRMMWDGWYGLTPEDRLMHAGAFNWTFTLGTGLLDPWAMGATALVPAPGTAPEALPLLMKRHDATIFAGAPGVFRKLIKEGSQLSLPKLRHGLTAGEKMPEALREAWRAATGTQVHEALGMSECSTFISGNPTAPAPEGTLGRPQVGRSIAVLSEDGAPVAPGEIGILAISEEDLGLFLGYLAEDGSLELPLQDGWFLTGDRVSESSDGSLIYHGRRDDLLTTGGFRISPLEIEAAFHGAEGVSECAASAVQVKAETDVLALGYVGEAEPQALKALAEARLARYKQPRHYARLSALPRSANGKLDRRALQARLQETL